MAYRWETPTSVWLEDATSGQFAPPAPDGLSQIDWPTQARGRLPDIAQLLGAALPASCQCAPLYPDDFAYCPQCGAALTPPASLAARPDWWGGACEPALPRQVPRGLPVTALALGEALERRSPDASARPDCSMPTPPNSQCVFGAAHVGFPVQRLLALAYSRNVLQYWDPQARLWHLMAGDDHAADLSFTAADYAWLPATGARRGEVALVPTRQGLCRLWINPINETYRTETVFDATLASAPGAVRKHIACLFIDAGRTHLWSALADASAVELIDCGAFELPTDGWSRPISYDDKLIWLHEQGHLCWQPGGAPQWLAWPQLWSPRRAFGGPVQSRDGRLWLIGHDGQAYSFLELGVPDGQLEALDGARLGFGKLLFRRGHAVIGDPWEPEHVEDPHEDDALVLPLLWAYNSERAQPGGLVLRCHKYTGKAETALDAAVLARVSVEWIGRRNVVLDELVRLARPGECLPFVYDGVLWLHHPDWHQLRGWRLDAPA